MHDFKILLPQVVLRLLLMVSFVEPERHEEFCKVVDDLHPTEDGEAGEEPHGASYEPQRRLSCHLLVFGYLIKSGCCKVDLDKLDWVVGDESF